MTKLAKYCMLDTLARNAMKIGFFWFIVGVVLQLDVIGWSYSLLSGDYLHISQWGYMIGSTIILSLSYVISELSDRVA